MSRLSLVFFKLVQLLDVERFGSPFADEVNSLHNVHAQFNQSDRHKHRSSAKPSNTMHSNCGCRVFLEGGEDDAEPFADDVVLRESPIRKRKLMKSNILCVKPMG